MPCTKWLAGVALVSGTFAFAAAAHADENTNVSGCISMQEQVKAALASNGRSANYRDAVRQKQIAQDYCSNGLYGRGVAHYAEALKLLGIEKS